MSRLLLDTHVVLWAFYAPERLSSAAANALMEADELAVSIVTPWEIALKFSRGGYGDLAVPENWQKSLMNELETQGYQVVPVESRHCRIIQDLPFHHKDPFDRMLVAQAIEGRMDLVSKDGEMGEYGVRRVW